MRVKTITLMALMGTLMVISQVALRFLPNIEVVSLLIILSSLAFGGDTLWAVGVFVIAQGMIYGFVPSWWLGYVVIWPMLCMACLCLRRFLSGNNLRRALFSGLFGLCFGLLYALLNFPVLGFGGAIGYWVAGFPFDALHMVGNYFLMLVLGDRLLALFMRQQQRLFGD